MSKWKWSISSKHILGVNKEEWEGIQSCKCSQSLVKATPRKGVIYLKEGVQATLLKGQERKEKLCFEENCTSYQLCTKCLKIRSLICDTIKV